MENVFLAQQSCFVGKWKGDTQMRRKMIGLVMSACMIGTVCSGCGQATEEVSDLKLESLEDNTGKKADKVVLTVWGAEEDQELLKKIVDGFQEEYKKDAKFEITIAAESEASCKETALNNVSECADVITFADDQLTAFAAAGILKPIENEKEIKEKSLEGAVEAASINDKLYAYPLTADNGYFMYYNKEYFSESDLESMESMLKVAEQNNKYITMDWNSGWYLYSFFANTGLELGLNDDGITNYCTWNSKEGDVKGTDVAQSMLNIAKNKGFLHGNDAVLTEGAKDGSVIAGISGVWLSTALKEAWGDDLGATKLPTYSCAGQDVQMGSFTGYKMVGVNSNSKNVEWASKLAEWITNEENQLLRYEMRGQGPANSNAASSEMVEKDIAINGLIAQSPYGSVQRIGGKYWEPVAEFGLEMAKGKTDVAVLQKTMDKLVEKITATE